MNNLHLAVQFFLQIAVILLFCRVVGAIAVRFGQPQVLVIMAVITTLMASPIFDRLVGDGPGQARPEVAPAKFETVP
ncbi:MAG: hypothetical protein QOE70_2851 [Chthoniobacter sp.]|jgi:hypothetical protein|nr:hypothetical protein [Chthoniobacter sp.]